MKRARWNLRYADEELLWSAGPNRVLAVETSQLAPARALDLACGEGRNAIWLAQQGWQVTAADFAEVALAKAARIAAERGVVVDFVHADLLAWVPPERSFELVCVLYLQLPAAERRLVLGRAAAAVAPGGTFLLVAHDLTNLTDGYGGPDNPDVLLTPEDVAAELPGLEIERAERILREVEGADRPAIDALVRARRP